MASRAVRSLRLRTGSAKVQVRSFTSWWHRWVDGKNPDNPQAAEVSDWLREQKIDPYLIPRDEIEDWRRQYLMRKHYPEYDVDKTKPEAEQQAEAEDPWGRLCKRKGHVVQRWQRMYPLSE
ncbi:unnamed protein product [Effrenium voratum]|uniref:Uncharacterized protein n=1 Tax=Effrenium voratum TaxID=2562239 RepID=A0AA36JBZ0_9DINO|nr:unnamed protein product [Effrenium voratum]